MIVSINENQDYSILSFYCEFITCNYCFNVSQFFIDLFSNFIDVKNSVYEDEESDDDSDSDYYMDVDEDDLDYIPSDEDEEIDSDLEFENM